MADTKITALTPKTSWSSSDVIPIVDNSGTPTTKKITEGNLFTSPTIITPVIASIVNTGTLTLPTSTDTLVGRATTDTLTNKSIDYNTNTITNLPSGTAFWSSVPGSPAYASATTFTLTDTANANSYDKLFKKGTVIRWTDSGGTTFKVGMVTTSSYGANTVTVTVKGTALSSGDTNYKYCIQMAETIDWSIPGSLAVLTSPGQNRYNRDDLYPLSVDSYVGTAGTTNATTFNIKDDGTTIMASSTTISIASTATTGLDYACNASTTAIAKDSVITCDISGVSTTAPVDAYVKLYVIPVQWRYRS